MKALFLWQDGPNAGQSLKRDGPTIRIGPKGENSIEVPGFQGNMPWAVVEYEKKHYYLIELTSPEGIFINDVAAPRGERQEIKGGAVVCLGPKGPRFKFGFEVEPQDLLANAGEGEEYSPSEAIRRMQEGLQHSGAQKRDVQQVAKKVQTLDAGVKHAERSVQNVERTGKKLWAGVLAALVIVAAVIFIIIKVQSGQQSKRVEEVEKKLSTITQNLIKVQAGLNASDEFFRDRAAASTFTREGLTKTIAEIDKQLDSLKKDPEKNRDEISRLEHEKQRWEVLLNGGQQQTEATLTQVYEMSLKSLVFLWVDVEANLGGDWRWVGGGSGTGFVIDDQTQQHVATAKHVVQPFKFHPMPDSAQLRYKIRAWRVGDSIRFTKRNMETGLGRSIPVDVPDSAGTWSEEANTIALQSWLPDRRVRCGEPLAYDDWGNPIYGYVEDGFDNDAALLILKGGPRMPALTLASAEDLKPESLKPLSPVLIAGFPLGKMLFEQGKIVAQPAMGHVRKFENFILHDAATCSGNSGGPLFDSQGKVIGLVNAARKSDSNTIAQNVNYSLPATRIRELLSQR